MEEKVLFIFKDWVFKYEHSLFIVSVAIVRRLIIAKSISKYPHLLNLKIERFIENKTVF